MRLPSAGLVVFLLVCCVPAYAQPPADPDSRLTVRPRIDNVTRAESWSFFEPPRQDADPDYTLVSNRARLGIEVDARRISFEGSFQYSQLLGLPREAFAGGPLGPGALYFAAARTPEAFQLYFKSMSLTLKDIAPHLSVRLGRMEYASDEASPHRGRLIGGAQWTVFERAFDGVRADYRRQRWRVHAAFLMPTQGAFEESASPTIGKLQIATTEVNSRFGHLFIHNYRDTRAVSARPDNTGIAASDVDVSIQTFGGSAAVFGVELWGAWQRGNWYGDAHSAISLSADAGHEWDGAPWGPAIRGGLLYASGDRDPGDSRHGTFFPLVPTTRLDLWRGTYAQMNLRDVYFSASAQPHQRLHLAAALHQLWLAHRQDRWYSGTGATAFRGDYFGFSSRPSTLRTGLGTLMQFAATTTLRPQWTTSASIGLVRGGDVVQRQFAGRTLWLMTLESTVSLPAR